MLFVVFFGGGWGVVVDNDVLLDVVCEFFRGCGFVVSRYGCVVVVDRVVVVEFGGLVVRCFVDPEVMSFGPVVVVEVGDPEFFEGLVGAVRFLLVEFSLGGDCGGL